MMCHIFPLFVCKKNNSAYTICEDVAVVTFLKKLPRFTLYLSFNFMYTVYMYDLDVTINVCNKCRHVCKDPVILLVNKSII